MVRLHNHKKENGEQRGCLAYPPMPRRKGVGGVPDDWSFVKGFVCHAARIRSKEGTMRADFMHISEAERVRMRDAEVMRKRRMGYQFTQAAMDALSEDYGVKSELLQTQATGGIVVQSQEPSLFKGGSGDF